MNTEVRDIVLVHGGFVDGSGWQGVYEASATRCQGLSSCGCWRPDGGPSAPTSTQYQVSVTGESANVYISQADLPGVRWQLAGSEVQLRVTLRGLRSSSG